MYLHLLTHLYRWDLQITLSIIHPSIHPSIYLFIHPKQENLIQLFRGDPGAFPGQPRDIVPPACPGSSRGPSTGGTFPETPTREDSGRHPNEVPEPTHLVFLYPELPPDDRLCEPIAKGETLRRKLKFTACSCRPYPKLKGKNKDPPVNPELCPLAQFCLHHNRLDGISKKKPNKKKQMWNIWIVNNFILKSFNKSQKSWRSFFFHFCIDIYLCQYFHILCVVVSTVPG